MANNAFAETIVVVDDNGYVTSTQRIVTTTNYTPQSQVTVVRETPTSNNYYYDSASTGTAIAAGITTAVVGTLLYNGIRHHNKHHGVKPAPFGGHRGFNGGKHRGGDRGGRFGRHH